MKRLFLVFGLFASIPLETQAAWDNVFQPSCFGKKRTTTSQYYAPPVVAQAAPVYIAQAPPVYVAQSAPVVAAPVCNSCPQPQQQCTTNYTQRVMYQPVTSYETKTYYEPVTTQNTSYYYEPVTSYRYTAHYDPCSCSYQQVAVPTTSYQIKAQSCPVQSWVARSTQVPVTTYQKSYYLEPKTTCCQSSVGALIPMPNGGQPTVAQAPPQMPMSPQYPQYPQYQQPQPQMQPQAPAFHSEFNQGAPQPAPSGPNLGTIAPPPASPSLYYGPQQTTQPQSWKSVPPAPAPAPAIRLDSISQAPKGFVQGQVAGLTSKSSVLFVNLTSNARQTAGVDAAGNFQANLPAGEWHVYVVGQGGAQYQHSVNVAGNRTSQLLLVSR